MWHILNEVKKKGKTINGESIAYIEVRIKMCFCLINVIIVVLICTHDILLKFSKAFLKGKNLGHQLGVAHRKHVSQHFRNAV